jgi:bifunctional non-homologous end joining protein LigD
MLATLERAVPHGVGWLFEVKWDGYRAIATIVGSECTLTSRRGNDLTQRFADVAKKIPKGLKTPHCVLDGEVCALDDTGKSSFSAMQQAKPGTPFVYYVFDVLEVEGEPLLELPLVERRKRLEKLLDRRSATVRLSEAFDDGAALWQAVCEHELEGIVAKRLNEPYLSGERRWVKVKNRAYWRYELEREGAIRTRQRAFV